MNREGETEIINCKVHLPDHKQKCPDARLRI